MEKQKLYNVWSFLQAFPNLVICFESARISLKMENYYNIAHNSNTKL